MNTELSKMYEKRRGIVIQELGNGFIFDTSHLLKDEGISAELLDKYEEKINHAGQQMNDLRESGLFPGHLSKDGQPEKVLFPSLLKPELSRLNRLKNFAETAKEKYDSVVSLGIGGSFLGNQVLFDLFCGSFWNQKSREERRGYPRFYFSGNNLDAEAVYELGQELERQSKASQSESREYRVLLVVNSKSGGTMDTMAIFFALKEFLRKGAIKFEVCAVTEPDGAGNTSLLGQLARENDWPCFDVPAGVGGRFSIFSESGLLTAALVGIDIEEFLHGGRTMDEACVSLNWRENPALLNGALKWLGAVEKDKWIEIFMPYGNAFKSLAEWYVQLMAESLGKRKNLAGEIVEYGRTPVVAIGTTDMHAQTQAHQDGRRDKMIQFVSVQKWRQEVAIPNPYPHIERFDQWAGVPMDRALEMARQANEEALASDYRWSANIILPTISPYHIGGLLYFLMLSVVYEGMLAQVDPFDQPGVEAYKKIMNSLVSSR